MAWKLPSPFCCYDNREKNGCQEETETTLMVGGLEALSLPCCYDNREKNSLWKETETTLMVGDFVCYQLLLPLGSPGVKLTGFLSNQSCEPWSILNRSRFRFHTIYREEGYSCTRKQLHYFIIHILFHSETGSPSVK